MNIGVGRKSRSSVSSTTVVMFVTDVVRVIDRAFLVGDVAHCGEGYRRVWVGGDELWEEEGIREEKVLMDLPRLPVGLYNRITRNISMLNSWSRSFSMLKLRKHVPPKLFGNFELSIIG